MLAQEGLHFGAQWVVRVRVMVMVMVRVRVSASSRGSPLRGLMGAHCVGS